MAPAKRKETDSSAGLSSKKTKMATTKPDIEEGEMKQEAPSRVQVPHACKEKSEDLTRALDFLLPTQEGAKAVADLAKKLGYDNGGKTIDWLLPVQTGRLQEVTRELGLDRGGQTIDWILPMVSKDFIRLRNLLGFQESEKTIQWLLDEAKPAIGRLSAATGTTGYSSPPYSTSRFSQNPQGTFTPTAGLGRGTTPTPTPTGGLGGSTARYSSSSNAHTFATPKLTPIQSSTWPVTAQRSDIPNSGGSAARYSSNLHTSTPKPGPVAANLSDLAIPNNYFNGFPDGQPQLNGYGQFQNSSRMMQPRSSPQSQIGTSNYQGIKSLQEASVQNIQVQSSTGPVTAERSDIPNTCFNGTPTHTGGPGGSAAWYQDPVAAHSSDLPILNNHFNGFTGGQPQLNGYGQFQPTSSRQSQIGTRHSQGKSQEASVQNIQVHNRVGSRLKPMGKPQKNRAAPSGNIVGPEKGVSTPMQHGNIVGPEKGVSTPMQYGHGASVEYGDSTIRMDQLQAPPQINHLIPRGSNSLNELARTCEKQTQTPAMQLPVENGDAASNNANQLRSWIRIPNPNPAQNSIMQMQAPADQNFEPEMEEGMKNNWQKRNLQGYRHQRSIQEMNPVNFTSMAMQQVDMPGSSVKDPVPLESDDD